VTITDVATITVQKVGSTVEITNDDPDPSTVGTNVVVEFEVTGNGGPPTGDVVVTISNGLPAETCTGTLANGSGSCSLPVTQPGTGSNNRRVITATYSGDPRFSGDTDTENHTVNPVPPANRQPTAAFTEACTGLSCRFESRSDDPDGDPLTYLWDFGDGATSTLVDPSHTYAAPGTYNVVHTVSDGRGGTDAATIPLTVAEPANRAPTANPDTYVTQAGVQRTVGQDEKLLNNDVDPDAGDILSVEYESEPTHGVIQFRSSDGTFDYTPNQDGSTTDSFTYHVRDLAGAVSNSTTVTFIINP